MSASIKDKTGYSGMDFLKRTVGLVAKTNKDYIKEAMPVTTSTLQEAKNAVSSVSSAFGNNEHDIFKVVRKMVKNANMKGILDWYMEKSDEYSTDSDTFEFDSFDIDTDDDDFAVAEISEASRNANKVSKAVTDSIHKSVEASITSTATLVTAMNEQSAIITSGFEKTHEILNKILEVTTKNTATIIENENKEPSVSQLANDMLLNKQFKLDSYKKIVASNVSNSMLGTVGMVVSSVMNILGDENAIREYLAPENLIKIARNGVIDKVFPNFKKTLAAVDDVFNESLLHAAIRMGEANPTTLTGQLVNMFGVKSDREEIYTGKSKLELKQATFDTLAHESIVTTIPGYLQKILAAVSDEDLVYDYRSRSFVTYDELQKDFNKNAVGESQFTSAPAMMKQAMGSDELGNMVYDLMINDLGAKKNGPAARNIISRFMNTDMTFDYLRNELLGGIDLDENEVSRISDIANNLQKAYKNDVAPDLLMTISRHNIERNARLQKYVNNANAYGVDLSDFEDSAENDRNTILARYGIDTFNSSISEPSYDDDEEDYIDANYTDIALYEIYRRLNKGINVFRVGTSNDRRKPFEDLTDKHLHKPGRYMTRPIDDESSPETVRSSLAGDTTADKRNLLENQKNEDGTTEDLTTSQRLRRWGSDRGKNLFRAIINGSPDQIKEAVGLIFKDVGQTTVNTVKRGASKFNKNNGNPVQYMHHMFTGKEYEFIGDDGKTHKVEKNEKGGYAGYINDMIFGPGGYKSSIQKTKETSSKWFKTVSGYFNYGDSSNDKSKDTTDPKVKKKRNRVIGVSAGALAGMGLVGGPLGILMGSIAGNAIGQTSNVGDRIHKMLFGDKDHQGDKKKDRQKRRGLIGRVVDDITDPIRYQVGKTMHKFGGILQKNILGPLSNIGYAIKERMSNAAGNVVHSVFGKMFKGATGLLKKVIGVPLSVAKVPISAVGGYFRTKASIAGATTGGVLNTVANVIGGKAAKKGLKERREKQKEDAKKFEKDGGYGSYKEWKNKQDIERDSKISSIDEYVKEQSDLAKENNETTSKIADDVDALAKEGLTKGSIYTHDEGLHTRLDDIISYLTGKDPKEVYRTHEEGTHSGGTINPNSVSTISNDNTSSQKERSSISVDKSIQPEERSSISNGEQSSTNNSLFQAATTIADEGGVDSRDIKDIEGIYKAGQRNEPGNSVFGKFKQLLARNKDKSDSGSGSEEEKESLGDTIVGGIKSLLKTAGPFILAALALTNDTIRDVGTNLLSSSASWLSDNLPSILSSAFSAVGSAGSLINDVIENNATGGTITHDEVTDERKSVISAEEHAEKISNGILSSAVDSGTDLLARAKDNIIMAGERSAIRLGSTLLGGGASLTSGLASATNVGAKAVQSSISFVQGVASNGLSKAGLSTGIQNASRVWNSALSGSSTAASVADGAKTVATSIDKTSSIFGKLKSTLKPSNLFSSEKAVSNAGTLGNIIGGAASNMMAAIGWDAAELAKHSNTVGDYGLGNAGGYAQTSTTAKTVVTTTIGMAGGMAIGTAMATAKAALLATATVNGWNPVGWAAMVTTGVLAASALLAAAANTLVGFITNNNNKDYAIRSNSAKVGKIINDGVINYVNGTDNPMYVYCGQESDRTIGLNSGMFIKDPDYAFGKYLKAIVDGTASSPGAIVLLYDWLRNMAVQGVPFAVMVAGSSSECKVSDDHANVNSTDGPVVVRSGILGGKYCQVTKKMANNNKEAIMADIWTNVQRQDSSCCWSYDNLVDVWEQGEEVVTKLISSGIFKDVDKVDTSAFKGTPGSGKNDSGWKALEKLCRNNDLYFLTKCLVYINSKVEANKNGQQWIEVNQDNIAALMEQLKDVIAKESESSISDGDDSSVGEAVEEYMNSLSTNDKATEVAGLTKADSTYSSISNSGIRSNDQSDVSNELKLLTASYAYSHPNILQAWVNKHKDDGTDTGISTDNVNNISNWESAFGSDKKKRKVLQGEMADASLKFAETQGDIFGLTDIFDWTEGGSIYTGNSKDPGEKYGAGFVIRGEKKASGKGILDKLWAEGGATLGSKYTPDTIHDKLFGNKKHGEGAENIDATNLDSTAGSSSVLGKIASLATTYGSKALKSRLGANKGNFRAVLIDLPSNNPKNLAVGGPPEEDDTITNESEISVGGELDSPINKAYKVTSDYGDRSFPYNGFHKGIDIVPADDTTPTDVKSTISGTIVNVKADVPNSDTATNDNGSWKYKGSNSTGNMVAIKSDDGKVVKNMHLKAGSIPSSIKEGEHIEAGDKIGEVGSTGWSTGPHLHYQVEDENGNSINPSSDINTSNTAYSTRNVGTGEDDTATNNASSLFSTIKEIGNNILYSITGGLVGSKSDTSSSSVPESASMASLAITSGVSLSSNSGSNVVLTTESNTKWLGIVKAVKAAVAANKVEYNQSGSTKITVNGTTMNVRTDCTGIIAAMLKLYGSLDMNGNINSTALLQNNAITSGFVKSDWPGWDSLVEGDIIVRSGHVEIFSHNDGSRHYVYNGGSTSALQSADPTLSSYASYSVIWRCQETTSTISNSIKLSNVSGTVSSSEEEIWNYLDKLGYSDVAKAGIMGTWSKETGNNVNTIEGNYLKSFPGTDTVLATNQSLNDWTQKLFSAYNSSGLKYYPESYKASDGNYYPGIGIAQWTGPRALNLINHANGKNISWRNVDGQMEFFNNEMENNVRGVTPSQLNSIDDVNEATKLFANKYEGTYNSSRISARQTEANRIYENMVSNEESVGGEVEEASTNFVPQTTNAASIGNNNFVARSMNASSSTTNTTANIGNTSRAMSSIVNKPDVTTSTNSQTNSIKSASSEAIENIKDLLLNVITELKTISGNTGTSNSLLNTLNGKEFVDTGLRETLSSRSSTGTKKTSASSVYRSSSTSAKAVVALAKP